MTDKENIRAYIEKLHQEHRGSEGDSIFRRALRTVLFYIDSMQEEPKECMYSKGNYTDKVQKIREEVEKLHGNPYYMMAVKDALAIIDSMQEEPSEIKSKCMYTNDNYTDEDRKVLCDGCEEDCKYNKKKHIASKVEDMLNAKTAAESLGISQEEHDRIVDELIYGKEPKLVDADDLPKEEPVSEEWIEELRTKLDSLSKEDFKKVFDKYAVDFKEELVSEVWHDANEEQPEEYRDFAFVDYDGVMWSRYRIEDLCHSWQSYVNMTGMTKWAYTFDLIKL